MDVGNKTLSQLSDEAKEKRYVTLDVGAKVSGYTKDYLERLCRLNKVEYRLWNKGQFVIEIDSLLRETHTILLSYEDITFVEKHEIVDSVAQNVAEVLLSSPSKTSPSQTASEASIEASRMFSKKHTEGITQSIPSFGGVNRIARSIDNDAFSFVGRAIVSDPLHPESAEGKNTHVPISGNSGVSIGINETKEPIAPRTAFGGVSHAPVHVAISGEKEAAATNTPAVSIVEKKSTHLSVLRDTPASGEIAPRLHDEWDAKILSGGGAPPKENEKDTPPLAVSSELHPVRTEVDARVHHDPAPLFPLIQKITPPITPPNATPLTSRSSGLPDLGPGKRVIVFSSQDIPKNKEKVSATIVRSGISASALVTEEVAHQGGIPTPSLGAIAGGVSPRVLASAPTRQVERVVPIVPEKRETMLPAPLSEQHVALRAQFPLAKSAGFNIAFVACLLLALASFQFNFPSNVRGEPSPYVAAVADADLEENFSVPRGDTSGDETQLNVGALPFSDEIYVATGTNPNTVMVSPVFGDKKVDPIEYIILRGGTVEQ